MVSLENNVSLPICILDGGFSTQLSCHVGEKVDGDPLWTARFLKTNPEDIVKTHLDFLRAGSDAILTNTYQASVGGFVKHLGLSPDEAYNLIKQAVALAKKAKDLYLEESNSCNRTITIVGSVGPYGAHLHDGSEYSGNYADVTSIETMKDWHRPRIQALIEAGANLLALETIPCQKEAEALLELMKEFPKIKAWLSFSCKDGNSLVHGEDFQTVVNNCWVMSNGILIAMGANCCDPRWIKSLLNGINEGTHLRIPLVVYPNSGEKYSKELGWLDKDKCTSLDTFVDDWLDLGVRYVGGCCRTYASDISKIQQKVQTWCELKKLKSSS